MVDMVPRQDRADLSAQAPWPVNWGYFLGILEDGTGLPGF